jgi:hypothetical protein
MNTSDKSPLSDRLRELLEEFDRNPYSAPSISLADFTSDNRDAIVQALETAERIWFCKCGAWNFKTLGDECRRCDGLLGECEINPIEDKEQG